MSENKEEILANFQSITGIDDIGEAFSHLEDTNWDLMMAIQRVMPQEDNVQPILPRSVDVPPLTQNSFYDASSSSRATTLNNFSQTAGLSRNCHRWDSSSATTESAFVPVASTSTSSADIDIIDLSPDIDLDAKPSNSNTIIFNIHYKQQIYTIRLSARSTVEQLKKKIYDSTKVPLCRQALRGWPPTTLHDAQKPSMEICNLGLSQENELILIDMTDEGYMDCENNEIAQRMDKEFLLTIVQQPGAQRISLNFPGRTTIEEVKQKVYYVSDIAVRHQEWTGWPHGCDNTTTLAKSGIELNHNFILHNAANNSQNNSKPQTSTRSNKPVTVETDSSADEFEDASDFNACEEFFTDSPPVLPPSRHLIANNTDSEASGSVQFVENYIKRFGEPHPRFFTGNLEEAIKEACHKPARERKLLAIYLHHGESILANVFCDHLMKHESIIQTFAQNYVLYGWDLTFESNKHLFLSSMTGCIGNTPSLTVRNIPIDKLPAILVIGKSRLSGRSTCEVLSVIHGNVGLDDLLTRLLESVEMYTEQLQGEIRDEEERAARDQVKAEQDMAYQATLQADMAKDAAKRQIEAAQAAERQRLESERAEEDARRECIRLVAEQSLPEEPNDLCADVTKIRVRKPTGEFLERKFYTHNTLQDLLNYVASSGFIIDEYKVISSWPRRDLTAIDANQTLLTLKLYPQETVILEER